MKYVRFLCMFGLLFASAAASPAAAYTFSNIIDSTVAAPTGNYLNIGEAAISGQTVTFRAGYDQGFFGIIDSIFVSNGGPRTKIVQELTNAPTGGTFSGIGRPSISGNQVYFFGRFTSGFSNIPAIYTGSGSHGPAGPITTTVINTDAVGTPYSVVADPQYAGGAIAFRGSTTSLTTPDALYITNTGSPVGRVVGNGDPAPPGGTFSGIDANYGASGGTVAFRGFYGSQEGIFTSVVGGPFATIAKEGDPAPPGGTFVSLLEPAISGGTAAFVGTYAGGSGIFTGNGGALTTVVQTGDATPHGNTFSNFSVPTIDGNTVAFRADYPGGGGIYTKTAGVLSTVIEIGNPLFGSTVATLGFSDLGLDPGGSGNLAFTYGLADGRNGVASATTGPPQPTIYEWQYINPGNTLFGKQPSAAQVADSVGVSAVPVTNLSNRNLTKAYLIGADLRNADAQSANLTDADLSSAELTNANFSNADLSDAVFNSARMTGTSFAGAEVRGTSFRRISLTTPCGSTLCTPITTFYGGITPAQLAATASYAAHDLSGIDLGGNILTNANLADQRLMGANLTGASLGGANFAGADIREANFGRYTIVSGCEGKPAWNSCRIVTNTFGTGLTLAQLTASASYLNHDMTGVDLSGNFLAEGNFAGQSLIGVSFLGSNLGNANLSHADLTNAVLRNATLTGANLSFADARGALFTDAVLTGVALTNFIQSDGHVNGLDLGSGQTLVVRDYDGDPSREPIVDPIAIIVDQHFAMGPGGLLKMVFDADAWNSTISFGPGIPVTLGGMFELTFGNGVNLRSQVGRTFDLFDWTGVASTGAFTVASPYRWNLSDLYTTGEVTLTGVPEPSTMLLTFAAVGWCLRRRRAA